ncbi:unnamed protein product [Cercospora beticola]|nr:unnamed protein product [Cercospora beticola]
MARPANCSALIRTGVATSADTDIAGTGILVAFLLSACLTLGAVLFAYFTGLVDDGLLRPVDRFVLKIPSRAARFPRAHVALRKAILTLSDQQIVTGIAILGAGFYGLRNGTISVYHFQIVIYLAWMSSSVHLSALTILRPWLYHHRGVLAWRLIGMLTLLAMLLVALVPTVSNSWAVISVRPPVPGPIPYPELPLTAFGVPAICFWGTTYGDGVNPDSVWAFVVLFISYLWKLGGIFMPVRSTFANYFRNPIDCFFEAILVGMARSYNKLGGRRRLFAFRIGLALYLPVVTVLETLGSFNAALWVSLLGLIFGCMQIIIPRELVQDINPDLAQQENKIGFGQLMPLILLIQPLGSISEHIWLKARDDEPLYPDPYSACLDMYQAEGTTVGDSQKYFLQFMATYQTPPRTSQAPQRIQLKAFLYSSKLFHAMVWALQAAVAAISVLIFVVDYETIGFTTSGNWLYMAFAAAGWLASAPLIVLLLAPWSKLGRYTKRERRASATSQTEPPKNLEVLRLKAMSQFWNNNQRPSSSVEQYLRYEESLSRSKSSP